ncbi:MAG: DUF3817 domain-containing protein [Pseudonocardiaceae bacterium]
MSRKAATLFRVVAVAEALSWAALLVGMFVKYVVGLGEGGVPVVGMVHGIVFMVYVVVALGVFRVLGWDFKTLAFALLASIPPLFTWFFEMWALRSGMLDGPEREQRGGLALYGEGARSVAVA